MNKVSVRCTLFVVALFMVLVGFGCSANQPGETAAEARRRHHRVMRINNQEFWSDIDRALLLDKPSKLTDMRLP